MRRGIPFVALLVPFMASIPPAFSDGGPKVYRFDPKGKVRAARAAWESQNAGAAVIHRAGLVLLVDVSRGSGAGGTDLVRLGNRMNERETRDSAAFYAPDAVHRWPCDGADAGPRAACGAVTLQTRVGWDRRQIDTRAEVVLLGPRGAISPDGEALPGAPCLFERSPATPPVFWDGALDLHPLVEEVLGYPGADGRYRVGTEPVEFAITNEVTRSDTDLFERDARIPVVRAADVDGDGTSELVALVGTDLVVVRSGADGKWSNSRRVGVPFLVRDPKLPAEEIRTPRLSIADVDADGKADLLVTLVQGRADKPGGLRTSLYRFPGPFFDEKTGALVEPQSRLDTESVALHASFVDVDGDGKLDYVADSIRGNVPDLIARIMGREPTTWYTVFRFDPEKKAFERKPWAAVERPYPADEARGNRFGKTGWLDGDFDGDGVKDLLDLGNLKSVTILAGTKSGEGAFTREILPKTPFEKPLATDAVIADLDGDGVSDAALWNEDGLILIVSGKSK